MEVVILVLKGLELNKHNIILLLLTYYSKVVKFQNEFGYSANAGLIKGEISKNKVGPLYNSIQNDFGYTGNDELLRGLISNYEVGTSSTRNVM